MLPFAHMKPYSMRTKHTLLVLFFCFFIFLRCLFFPCCLLSVRSITNLTFVCFWSAWLVVHELIKIVVVYLPCVCVCVSVCSHSVNNVFCNIYRQTHKQFKWNVISCSSIRSADFVVVRLARGLLGTGVWSVRTNVHRNVNLQSRFETANADVISPLSTVSNILFFLL